MMEENKINSEPISYMAFESVQARNERITKRLSVALIIAIILMFLSNAMWLNAWLSYDYTDETESEIVTVDTDGGGNANYIGQDGDIVNGESDSNEEKENTNKDTQVR